MRALGRSAAIVFIAASFAFPLYWMTTMAFKPVEEWEPPGKVIWVPKDPTLDNFRILFGVQAKENNFLYGTFPSAVAPIEHSLIAAIGGTIFAVFVGVLAGYGSVRVRRRTQRQFLIVRLVPPIVFLIPLFFLWVNLSLWDTVQGLVILYACFVAPFVVLLLRGVFARVPRELGEAAIVDGCNYWGAFFKVVLPQAKTAIAAATVFAFVLTWSDLMIANVMTLTKAETATVYLNGLHNDEITEYGPQAALGLLLLLPPALLGIAIRRYLVQGLTLGAIN